MPVVSYFPISVPAEMRESFEHSWKNRVGAVDTFPGFISTELLALPDRSEYVVLTRFEDEKSFEAWITSDNFTRGHRGEAYESYRDNPMMRAHKLYEALT